MDYKIWNLDGRKEVRATVTKGCYKQYRPLPVPTFSCNFVTKNDNEEYHLLGYYAVWLL
jgi:hypothetical protein